MKKIIVLLFLLFLIPCAFSQPRIESHVTDKAGVLSQEAVFALETNLRQLQKDTNGVQFVVYIENEYPKEFSLEEYTLKIAEQNKIGKGENDNGVLFYLAVKDRVYRWEVGYGAESTLNSPLLGRISREYLVPNFQKNDYENGILSAVDVTSRILLNSSDSDIIALKNQQYMIKPSQKISIALYLVFFIFTMVFAVVMNIKAKSYRKKHGKWPDYYYTGAAGGMFAGGFGRRPPGGFGGFGGFSGGGGGFGGGGFSGGWGR